MVVRDQMLFLEDILEAIGRIEEYTQDMDFESFASDKKTFDAVIRNQRKLVFAGPKIYSFRASGNYGRSR